MLNRKSIFAVGLGTLLSIAVLTPAVADQNMGGRHTRQSSSLSTTPYVKTHHRHYNRGHNQRRHRSKHRRAHRHDHRRRSKHHYYRTHRHGNVHEFASGLVFGGVLGYIIGNDY
ncbi:MAG: hypothetical protein GY792_36915 [Gammaproteobacteria bacterium]|nr:hypothetical protein [Gammaproteobacteria bacterium]